MGNKIRVGIFGSCATREVFTTYYNDYKNHFELKFSHERESFISLFQDPLDFDIDELELLPKSKKNDFRTRNMANDFSKSFFNDLNTSIDYLIIDVYFEALFGVLILEDGNIITNNKWDLPKTDFYKKLDNFKVFSMLEDSKEYFKSWKNYCDKFFKYMNETYPNVKIILNKMNLVYHVLKEDYSFYVDDRFKNMFDTFYPFILNFENYIEENYDVISIEYDNLFFTSELNRWSPYVVHFMPDYYKYVYFMLCKIVGVDDYTLISANLNYVNEKNDFHEKIWNKYEYTIKNQENKISNLEKSLEETNKMLTLKDKELNVLRNFKSNVLNSSSWKITKPFRDLNSTFKK